MSWVSTIVPPLAERADEGTAIAAKIAKIGGNLRVCRVSSAHLQNDKREAPL